MDHTFDQLLDVLKRASSPSEVFGVLMSEPQRALQRRYRELAGLVHPDAQPARSAEAHGAFIALQRWYAEARRQLERGCYGAPPLISATTQRHRYRGYAPPIPGDLCDLFAADADGAPVLLKVVRRPHNNDLLAAEAAALRRLDRELADQPVRAHFPTLVEDFQLRDAAGAQRQANALCAEAGYVALADVVRAHPGGLEPADAAWMFNRILCALGLAHDLGLVHGAVTPAHVLIRPADHNGLLIDWCYSVDAGAPLKAISRPYAADYPPEVLAREPATPATDVYMAARCMVRLLGGNGDADTLPAGAPRPLRALLRACLLPAPQRRIDDAWQVFDDFRNILDRLYGPPAFRPFLMQ